MFMTRGAFVTADGRCAIGYTGWSVWLGSSGFVLGESVFLVGTVGRFMWEDLTWET